MSACGWPGAEHGHHVAARAVLALLDIARQLVELADRALEVLLPDLVVCGRHRLFGFRPARVRSFSLHRYLPRLRPFGPFVWMNLSAWT